MIVSDDWNSKLSCTILAIIATDPILLTGHRSLAHSQPQYRVVKSSTGKHSQCMRRHRQASRHVCVPFLFVGGLLSPFEKETDIRVSYFSMVRFPIAISPLASKIEGFEARQVA